MLAIVELTTNLLYGNIRITPEEQDSLKTYGRAINYIADEGISLKKKHSYLLTHRIPLHYIISSVEKHISDIENEEN